MLSSLKKNWLIKTITFIAILIALFSSLNLNKSYAQEAGSPIIYDPNVNQEEIEKIIELQSDSIDSIDICILSPIKCAIGTIIYILGLIASGIFTLSGLLISYALDINSQILNMQIVHTGWSMARDIINLGFVLGILIIAFATILRQEQYGARDLMFKFIVIAVMVNFSLVISGVILDVAGITTAFLANQAIAPGSGEDDEGWVNFASSLASLTQVDKLTKADIKNSDIVNQGSAGLIGLLTALVFTVLSSITFLGIVIMLLARFIYLAVLLIAAPLAWFSSIFPILSDYYKKWWDQFFRWTFFAPVMMFFLMLASTTLLSGDSELSTINKLDSNLGDRYKASKIYSEHSTIALRLDQLGTLLIVNGFLVASLLAGQSFGIAGADMAMGWAKGTKNWAIKQAKRGAAKGGKMSLRGGMKVTGLEKVAKKWQEQINQGESTSRFKALATKTIFGQAKIARRSEVELRKKQFSSMSDDELRTQYNITDKQGKAAIMEIMAEKDKLHKLPVSRLDFKSYQTYGGDENKLSKNDLLLKVDKNDKKNVRKTIQSGGTPPAVATAIANQLNSMSAEDIGGLNLNRIIEGHYAPSLGIAKEVWRDEYQPAVLEAITKIVKSKELGGMLKGSSISERNKLSNLMVLTMLGLNISDSKALKLLKLPDTAEQKDIDEALKNNNIIEHLSDEQAKQAKAYNESAYNYLKNSLHSAISKIDEDKKEDKSDKQEEKSNNNKPNFDKVDSGITYL